MNVIVSTGPQEINGERALVPDQPWVANEDKPRGKSTLVANEAKPRGKSTLVADGDKPNENGQNQRKMQVLAMAQDKA